jgi:hypothetical protein
MTDLREILSIQEHLNLLPGQFLVNLGELSKSEELLPVDVAQGLFREEELINPVELAFCQNDRAVAIVVPDHRLDP